MGGERGRAVNDHHGNSLNRVVTLADFITTRLQAGGQEGTPSQQPATTRVELGMGKDDHPTERVLRIARLLICCQLVLVMGMRHQRMCSGSSGPIEANGSDAVAASGRRRRGRRRSKERNIEKWFTIAKYLISTHFNKSSLAVPAPGSTSNNNT